MDAQHSAALIAQIDGLAVPHGQLALWSLGQAGFVIKGGATLAYIDPYLSDRIDAAGNSRRRFPPPLDASQIAHAQVVFTTHEHNDHTDGQTLGPLMAASRRAMLVCSPQSRAIALHAGIAPGRIIVPRLGQRAELAGLAYTAIPAAHYSYEVDEAGQSRWMGFLIECNGVSLYHAGDTLVIPELLAALDGRRIDIALLPFNGRDAFRDERGTIGNMWPREVVALAGRLGAGVLIGIHNDLFEQNRVNPGMLFDELDHQAPWQRCHLLQPGELYLYVG
jgi:L-ascorbate metabolism protein UlaG (beta-lactamase superfamily)